MNYGKVFKRFRLIRGKSVKDVSEHLGVDEDIYSKWESGIIEPTIEQVMGMATYYNCSMDLLLDVDGYIRKAQ